MTAAWWLAAALLAAPRTAFFTLAIGYNGVPPGWPADATPEPLRFADDDAAAIYHLARDVGHRAILLAAPDPDTRRRMPDLVEAARPPSLAELDRTIAELNRDLDAAAQSGGDLPNAVGVYRRAAEMAPFDPAPLIAAGDVLLQMGNVN